MDNTSYTIRVPKRLGRIAAIVGVLALIVAPLAAVATHSFNDVPNSHTFHEDIAWMKASGVTRGCNPPANTQYCPEDDVKRSQMAAFMRRFAQYLGAEDGTPAQADNADTLDGFDAADLVRAVGSATDNPANDGAGVYETVLITAPVDGMLYVNAVSDVIDTTYGCRLLSNGDRFPGPGFEMNVTYPTWGACPISAAAPVSAGTYTIEFELTQIDLASGVEETSLSALFVPFGGDGAQPTSFMATDHGNSSDDSPGG